MKMNVFDLEMSVYYERLTLEHLNVRPARVQIEIHQYGVLSPFQAWPRILQASREGI